MAILRNIILHHAGPIGTNPFSSSLHLTWQHIDNAHKERWNFISAMGFFGGYNIYIDQVGNIKQFRLLGEETAAQKGYNFDSISICLSGNFTEGVDQPTDAQKMTLKRVLQFLLDRTPERIGLKVSRGTVLDLSLDRIKPHREFSSTTCYGNLPDNWGQTLLYDYNSQVTILKRRLDELMKLLQTLLAQLQSKKLSSIDRDCGI
ncbi:MAG: peptidoglycan recognition family protein [Patescibacteria group bacterium]|mgnify:FL=1